MKLLLLLLIPFTMAAQNSKTNNIGFDKGIVFVNSLSESQKKKAVFAFDEMNRYEWHYFPASMIARTGICVKDLDSSQKKHLYNLLKAYLSAEGYSKTKNIMDYENILHEIDPNNKSRIAENYFVAIYGSPGKKDTWGWKFSGHHVALNFTIVDDKLAFAPFFFGVNPAEIKEGPKKGIRLMKDEEDLGFKLLKSLSQEQNQKAVFQNKTFSEIVTTNEASVTPLKPVGILGSDLTNDQKIILNQLIHTYLKSMPNDIAIKRMKKITSEEMNDLQFGWAGEQEMGKPHYYRVQGKTFLIEFDNTQSNANHIHTVWRDFNGDYGRDLLRDHYQNAKHHSKKKTATPPIK